MADQQKSPRSSEENALRRHLHKALNSDRTYSGFAFTLHSWQQQGWGPILFGGFLRDLMIFGFKRWPRDIDIVVKNRSVEQLKQELMPVHPRQNRFGGFHCELSRWECDVWPLQSTWAFHRAKLLEPSVENLPKTTFLNVEAIAAEIAEDGLIGEIHDSGFFDALRSRTLDINMEENPFPSLAAVRALITARKLNFAISLRLSNYIIETAKRHGTASFLEAQSTHYGSVRYREQDIEVMLQQITYQVRTQCGVVKLRGLDARQLRLWELDR